ncbi:MAG: hypothetical protein ACREP1_10225, partial [Rhodanobacteraceae bacterium]
SEAWLNRAGTLIAVVWKSSPQPDSLLKEIETKASGAGCCAHGEEVTELRGAARAAALKEFDAGGWYRGADVDRLSKEEAGVIAGRLVSRVQMKTPLTPGKAQALEKALRAALSKRLIKGDDGNCEPEFQKIAAEFLDDHQTAALQEAIESGFRPAVNEK